MMEGQDGEALAARWGLPSCIWRERVTSTLDVVHEQAENG